MRPLVQSDRPASWPAGALQSYQGEVLECHGSQSRVQTALGLLTASLATHVPGVEPGQQVVLQCPSGSSPGHGLIVAAYPLTNGQSAPNLHYDASSRTLKISATLSTPSPGAPSTNLQRGPPRQPGLCARFW